ncbi:MAG: hypothetical protein ACP5MW_04570 [Thermoplasmata archaeon]
MVTWFIKIAQADKTSVSSTVLGFLFSIITSYTNKKITTHYSMMAYIVKLAIKDGNGLIITGLGFLFSLLAIIFGFIHLAVGNIISLWYAVGFGIIAILLSGFSLGYSYISGVLKSTETILEGISIILGMVILAEKVLKLSHS